MIARIEIGFLVNALLRHRKNYGVPYVKALGDLQQHATLYRCTQSAFQVCANNADITLSHAVKDVLLRGDCTQEWVHYLI